MTDYYHVCQFQTALFMFMSCKFLRTVINIRTHCSPYLDYMYTCNHKNVICTNIAQIILIT